MKATADDMSGPQIGKRLAAPVQTVTTADIAPLNRPSTGEG